MNSITNQDQKTKQYENEYFINLSNFLTKTEEKIIIILYQPILGLEIIGLYNFLISQIKSEEIEIKIFENKIFKFCNLTKEKLEKIFNQLEDYGLLSIEKLNYNMTKIKIKHPVLFNDFFKKDFLWKKLDEKITRETLKEIYLKFNKNTENDKEKLENNIKKTSFMKKMKYIPKLDEYNLFQELTIKHSVPIKIIGLIYDFVLFKNTGKTPIPYMIKLIEDLDNKNILFDFKELKNYFIKIFKNITINKYLSINKNNVPDWLLNSSFNLNISINKKNNKKKENNDETNDFISQINKNY